MPAEPGDDPASLDARLQAAAQAGDAGSLARAYAAAAAHTAAADEAGFFRTHAYVWALVAGDRQLAENLAAVLRRDGRLD